MENGDGYKVGIGLKKGLFAMLQALIVPVALAVGGMLSDPTVVGGWFGSVGLSPVYVTVIVAAFVGVGKFLLNWAKQRSTVKLQGLMSARCAQCGAALAFLFAFLLLPAFAHASERQFGLTTLDLTPRTPRPFTASFETGVASTWTNGVKDERAAVIAFADIPYKRGGSATRIDIAGSRGQQTVDLSNPQTFRSAEILTALYFEALSGVDAICFGGVGLSIEGSNGAPLDTRMYTGGCGVRVRAFKQALLAGWGQRGSIQGQGFLGSLHLTKGDKTRVHIDGAIRARSLVTGRRPWELRSSATVVVWKR